jgi:hypothetical protein
MPSPPPRATAKAATPSADAGLEDSILSAIADAVDILVEDENPPRPAAQPRPEPAPAAPRVRPAAPAAAPAPKAAAPENDEIGDEIQRILATYNSERR